LKIIRIPGVANQKAAVPAVRKMRNTPMYSQNCIALPKSVEAWRELPVISESQRKKLLSFPPYSVLPGVIKDFSIENPFGEDRYLFDYKLKLESDLELTLSIRNSILMRSYLPILNAHLENSVDERFSYFGLHDVMKSAGHETSVNYLLLPDLLELRLLRNQISTIRSLDGKPLEMYQFPTSLMEWKSLQCDGIFSNGPRILKGTVGNRRSYFESHDFEPRTRLFDRYVFDLSMEGSTLTCEFQLNHERILEHKQRLDEVLAVAEADRLECTFGVSKHYVNPEKKVVHYASIPSIKPLDILVQKRALTFF
jgi:hypothetical protein